MSLTLEDIQQTRRILSDKIGIDDIVLILTGYSILSIALPSDLEKQSIRCIEKAIGMNVFWPLHASGNTYQAVCVSRSTLQFAEVPQFKIQSGWETLPPYIDDGLKGSWETPEWLHGGYYLYGFWNWSHYEVTLHAARWRVKYDGAYHGQYDRVFDVDYPTWQEAAKAVEEEVYYGKGISRRYGND